MNRTVFRQICELIPPHLVPVLAREHGVRSRSFSPWSHLVSMLYAQFTHALGPNDVCDSLRANRSALAAVRGATPPSRNGLSHANKTRNAKMAEALFWKMLDYLRCIEPGVGGGAFRKMPRGIKGE